MLVSMPLAAAIADEVDCWPDRLIDVPPGLVSDAPKNDIALVVHDAGRAAGCVCVATGTQVNLCAAGQVAGLVVDVGVRAMQLGAQCLDACKPLRVCNGGSVCKHCLDLVAKMENV